MIRYPLANSFNTELVSGLAHLNYILFILFGVLLLDTIDVKALKCKSII